MSDNYSNNGDFWFFKFNMREAAEKERKREAGEAERSREKQRERKSQHENTNN